MRWAIAAIALWLVIWFVIVGYEAFLQRAYGHKSPFDLLEFHHAYLGAALVALGFRLHTVTGCFVQLLGLSFLIDDLIQHVVQTYSDDRDYRSPLHEVFAKTLWKLPFTPALVHFLDTRWWALAMLGAIAWLALSCAPARLVPGRIRPDTRALSGIIFDTAVVRAVVQRLRAAYPREAAVCLYGEILDTVIDGQPRRIVHVASMQPSAEDSANEMHVWFPRGRVGGCDDVGLVGVAHSHPMAIGARPCTHSDPDANVLFLKPRALFSMLFCGDGRGEIFYQDGRRSAELWARPIPASP